MYGHKILTFGQVFVKFNFLLEHLRCENRCLYVLNEVVVRLFLLLVNIEVAKLLQRASWDFLYLIEEISVLFTWLVESLLRCERTHFYYYLDFNFAKYRQNYVIITFENIINWV